MTEQIPGRKPTTTEQILDLLLDALSERQRTRRGEILPSPQSSPEGRVEPSTLPSRSLRSGQVPGGEEELPPTRPEPPASEPKRPTTPAEAAHREPLPVPAPKPEPGEKGWQPPERLPSIQMGRFLGRLAIAIAVLVVLVNIPVKSHGVSLARMLPDTASLIIRDGLVLKGSGSDIYILRDNKLRWISDMATFDHLGLTWDDVHVVDDKFLEQFDMGYPISIIYKCATSPHIYTLENGKKRWIKDIETFTSLGYHWEDVQIVSCVYLRNLPDGLPLPGDAGTPPQP
jgi:hypothetical protein